MKQKMIILYVLFCIFIPETGNCTDKPAVSNATQQCLGCHSIFHPGIVEDWKKSRHSKTTPQKAMTVKEPGRKVSSPSVSDALKSVVVGCAECHTQNPDAHADTFSHNGFDVHVVVSPEDCASCHSQERAQYGRNIMSHAWKNLAENKVYVALKESITGNPVRKSGKIVFEPPNALTDAETCFNCHGTKLKVTGFEIRDTDVGNLEFPKIAGWPNQGVGRINTDGSLGACTSCHNRHSFSIEMARKPHTCKQCHKGPDVPAYQVYEVSKHGNIFSSKNAYWDFKAVPWTVGKDFTAPTCATCHISLLTNTDGGIVAQRTHQMTDRLSNRIFGLIYAHRQPKNPDTTIIRNKTGLALPTDFDGSQASQYLIDDKEYQKRQGTMQAICLSCHSKPWVDGHWVRYENTIKTTNAAILSATEIMQEIWKKGYASGLDRKSNPFDEGIERKWMGIWLFDANNIRFAAAMAGGGDYGVFAEGRYPLSTSIVEMNEWLKGKQKK